MMTLEDIKNDIQLVNAIDWDMTPEEAVRLYLEWGNNWAHGKSYVIRSKNDVSHYFVIYHWDDKPTICFVRRNSEEVKELAVIDMTDELIDYFYETCGNHKGVFAIEGKIKDWLKQQLDI